MRNTRPRLLPTRDPASETMDTTPETAAPPNDAPREPPRTLRLPTARASAGLAAAMLAVGVLVGAAIGPAPDASFAGGAAGIAQRLPLLLASLAGRAQAAASGPASTQTTPAAPPLPAPTAPTTAVSSAPPAKTTSASTPSTTTPSRTETPPSTSTTTGAAHETPLPAITNVWLIELAGTSFAQALTQPSAAPYIDGQAIPASTLLGGWSALAAGTFAGDAALAAPTAPGATPPLLHSIVQPPCPEGAAGAACAPETAGQLTAADEFLKATLAQITPTALYREHGLIVVTFATVGVAAQAGLPATASTATLTSQPPAGVVLMSPFARAGARPTTSFDPTSPRQSLEALLR